MGIQNLLPFVRNACRPANVREFSSKTVAVDGYCLIHKGAIRCAEKLAKGEESDVYVSYVTRYVKLLLALKMHVVMVFDGASLPAKSRVDAERRAHRAFMTEKAKRLLMEGKDAQAGDCFRQAVEVTKLMVTKVIQACRALTGVDCIVAPFEADAQLAFFALNNFVDLIITEDSDLIVFGCDKVLFKMDFNGNGLLFEKAKLSLCFGNSSQKFSFEKFRRLCILSGCDYLRNLPGIGLKKATKFFSRTWPADLRKILPRLPLLLRIPSSLVTEEYVNAFIAAELTFLHQIVFDPIAKRCIPLTPYPAELSSCDMPYCGTILRLPEAYELALGNLNPKDLSSILGCFSPSEPAKSKSAAIDNFSIWHPDFVPGRCLPTISDEKATEPNIGNLSAFQSVQSYSKALPAVAVSVSAVAAGASKATMRRPFMKGSVESAIMKSYGIDLRTVSKVEIRQTLSSRKPSSFGTTSPYFLPQCSGSGDLPQDAFLARPCEEQSVALSSRVAGERGCIEGQSADHSSPQYGSILDLLDDESETKEVAMPATCLVAATSFDSHVHQKSSFAKELFLEDHCAAVKNSVALIDDERVADSSTSVLCSDADNTLQLEDESMIPVKITPNGKRLYSDLISISLSDNTKIRRMSSESTVRQSLAATFSRIGNQHKQPVMIDLTDDGNMSAAEARIANGYQQMHQDSRSSLAASKFIGPCKQMGLSAPRNKSKGGLAKVSTAVKFQAENSARQISIKNFIPHFIYQPSERKVALPRIPLSPNKDTTIKS